MFSENQIKNLKNNWGARADALACNAEVRIVPSVGSAEFYIYALNPEDEKEAMILIGGHAGIEFKFFKENIIDFQNSFNHMGVDLEIDCEYRPKQISEIIKKLKEAGPYERNKHKRV